MVINSPPPVLKEKDFIQEGYSRNPFPFWLWIFILTAVMALIWGTRTWFGSEVQELQEGSPFLQVTNREMSLFLWQFPEYMRNHVPNKTGYLPAFQYGDHIEMEPELADKYVAAPPELLFLYHTWHRLLWDEFSERPIPLSEFLEFLKSDEAWQPRYWPEAPEGYKKWYIALSTRGSGSETLVENLAELPMTIFPLSVRRAFQGWKNYYKEGKKINQIKPTVADIQKFLAAQPHYGRSYWRNIVADTTPQYLRSLSVGRQTSEQVIPEKELAPFLKMAIFNFFQSNKNQ